MKAAPQGYLAEPESGTGPGVLVLHAWWGLNDTIKNITHKLADDGFVAFAPDIYQGRVTSSIPDAESLAKALDHQLARAMIADAAGFLCERTGKRAVAVIGFSLGAYYALDLAGSEPGRVHSAVLFYGTGDANAGNSRAVYLGHFAENDEFEPLPDVHALKDALEKAGRNVLFHHYPGTGHWFAEPDRKNAYDHEASELAWKRTLAFLRR